jgi:hypothetical protein
LFPLLVSWNEFAATPIEAPPGSITTLAYNGYMRSKLLQTAYVRVRLSKGVGINGSRD